MANSSHRDEYLKRKRNRRILRYGILVFVVIFLVALASYVSHRPSVRISKVELSGGVLVTQDAVEQSSLLYVQGSYFWLFPKDNVFWYPHNKLEEYLKDTFKRIDTIDIHLKDFHTLAIDITERKPVATWCTGEPEMQPSGNEGALSVETRMCYFIDQDGVLFSEAPYFSGDAYFKYYGSISPTDNPIGMEYVASSTKFAEMSDFVTKVKELSISPLYVIAKGDDEFSLVLYGGGEIYFNARESLSVAGKNLEALLRTLDMATTTGNLPVEYVDLRYGNKLFYKARGLK